MSGKSKLLKIVVIGDSTTGKTALIERFGNSRFGANVRPTVGIDYREKKVEVQGKMYTLQIWDTAGQERFNSITRPYYKGADCCLLTFALDNLRSFENISKWKTEFLDYADIQDGNMFPFVILGNKVDVENKMVTKEMVKYWFNKNGHCPYYETSAKDDTNVDEGFITAVERYIELEKFKRHIEMETTKRCIDLETSKRFIELENREDVVRKRHKKEKSLDMKFPQGSTVNLSKKPKQTSGRC